MRLAHREQGCMRALASPNFATSSKRPTRVPGRGMVRVDQRGKTGQALLFGFHHDTSMTFVMGHIEAI
jgi:hypothetical protein